MAQQVVLPDIHIERDWWLAGWERLKFSVAATWWIIGMRFSGKSSLAETIATKYIVAGSTLFDLFGARDNESLGWLRSPFSDSCLLLHGDGVKITSTKHDWPTMTPKTFNLDEAEKYKVVVTCPSFYTGPQEMYETVSRIVDILKVRSSGGYSKIDVLLVREAANLIASRIFSGAVTTKFQAEYDFIDLHNQAYHVGVANIIDSLRPLSIDVSVRDLANYTFVKRLGKMIMPDEFDYLMKLVKPSTLRRIPVEGFVLWTDSDNVAMGNFDEVPWHIVRGENLLSNLGLQVEVLKQTDADEKGTRRRGAPTRVTHEIHQDLVKLREEELSYEKIIEIVFGKYQVNLGIQTIRNQLLQHKMKACHCPQD